MCGQIYTHTHKYRQTHNYICTHVHALKYTCLKPGVPLNFTMQDIKLNPRSPSPPAPFTVASCSYDLRHFLHSPAPGGRLQPGLQPFYTLSGLKEASDTSFFSQSHPFLTYPSCCCRSCSLQTMSDRVKCTWSPFSVSPSLTE